MKVDEHRKIAELMRANNLLTVRAADTLGLAVQINFSDQELNDPAMLPLIESMLAYDLPPVSGEPPKRKVGTRCFDALVYHRALFPLVPGRFVIAPAQLVYSLPLSSSFFSREESHELVTDSTILVAIDPPSSGRPTEYTGAIGDLSIEKAFGKERLDGANLDLRYANGSVAMKGEGRLWGVPASIEVRQPKARSCS